MVHERGFSQQLNVDTMSAATFMTEIQPDVRDPTDEEVNL